MKIKITSKRKGSCLLHFIVNGKTWAFTKEELKEKKTMQHYALVWEDDVFKGYIHYAVFDNEEDIGQYVKELFGEGACKYCDYINKDKTIVFYDISGEKYI